jgi:ABC-type Na+ efflux pump permease subunit
MPATTSRKPLSEAWLALSLFLPVIPMLVASFLGFLIARVSAGFRKTNIVQTILTFAFVLACFGLRFVLEGMFRDDKVQVSLMAASRLRGSGRREKDMYMRIIGQTMKDGNSL